MSRQRIDQKIQYLPIELIVRGCQQARRLFDEQALRDLADSIAESGIVQPLVVRARDNEYELLAGERRWRAAQLAGLPEVPAVIRNDLDDREANILGLIENLQRESLSPMETARGLDRLIRDYDLTHAKASTRIGKSRVYVTNYLRLLQLERPVQKLVDEQKLTLGHAKVLAGMPENMQLHLARYAARDGWSVRTLEKRYAGFSTQRDRRPEDGKAMLGRMESQLSDRIGNRVRIRYSTESGRGELRIAFHDLDEFEGLLQRLGCHDLAGE